MRLGSVDARHREVEHDDGEVAVVLLVEVDSGEPPSARSGSMFAFLQKRAMSRRTRASSSTMSARRETISVSNAEGVVSSEARRLPATLGR